MASSFMVNLEGRTRLRLNENVEQIYGTKRPELGTEMDDAGSPICWDLQSGLGSCSDRRTIASLQVGRNGRTSLPANLAVRWHDRRRLWYWLLGGGK